MSPKKFTKRVTSFVVAFAMVVGMFPQVALASDYDGHWAKDSITSLVEKGIVTPDSKGNTNPNGQLTRAQMAVLVNKTFGLTEKAEINFSDVKSTDWFNEPIAIAFKEGYMTGDKGKSTVRPNDSITRQEVASVLGRMLSLVEDSAYVDSTFKDAASVGTWAKGHVGALTKGGVIHGYEDNTFKPTKNISRAEAFVLINNVSTSVTVDEKNVVSVETGKTLGDADKITELDNVVVKGTGAKLQNLTIAGNLTIDPAVGNGEVTLEGVQVLGDTKINGGGSNSIIVGNSKLVVSKLVNVKVDKEGVSLKVNGGKVVAVSFVNGGKLLVGKDGSVESVSVDTTKNIIFGGIIDKVAVNTANASVTLDNATVGELEVTASDAKVSAINNSIIKLLEIDKSAKGSTITLAKGTQVLKAIVDAVVAFKGEGKVAEAVLNVKDVTFVTLPTKTEGEKATQGTETPTSGGGGGGGGSTPTPVVTDPTTGVTISMAATTAGVAPEGGTRAVHTITITTASAIMPTTAGITLDIGGITVNATGSAVTETSGAAATYLKELLIAKTAVTDVYNVTVSENVVTLTKIMAGSDSLAIRAEGIFVGYIDVDTTPGTPGTGGANAVFTLSVSRPVTTTPGSLTISINGGGLAAAKTVTVDVAVGDSASLVANKIALAARTLGFEGYSVYVPSVYTPPTTVAFTALDQEPKAAMTAVVVPQ